MMVCAMHSVWGVSIRRSCGCDGLCHASCVWGVSIRTSCGCDGLCHASRVWGVSIRTSCGCDGLCRALRVWGVSIRTSCGCDGLCCALQELAFVAGLVRVGCFNQNELLDVLHMLFPGKTEEDIQEILQRIMDGTQKDADKDM